ncbi:sensor histidine kinase [Paenibacillus sp. KS-LC4]|uniref:sensor histidine kinase n=1 Tax=Paenibacillus sp. KS-LC4 TaxID=2979727 RepID=UPI0030CD5812
MFVPFYWFRGLLIAVPAVISVFSISSASYAIYTIGVLVSLSAIKLVTLFPKYVVLILFMELLGFGWFAYHFGGVLFLLLFSTLIAALSTKPSAGLAAIWLMAGGICLWIAMRGLAPSMMAAMLLLWLTIGAVLQATQQVEGKRSQVEALYAALAHSHEELEAARRRMQSYASQIEQYAQTEERNRIARDIHDDLGHRLIRVKMMSEAALHLFQADPARAQATVGQIRDQLQDSMERMRQTVRRLAVPSEGDSRQYALDRLVKDSGEALGIAVAFEVQGNPLPLYPSMEFILFKNAQEAITNAVRHGGATRVKVTLLFQPRTVALTIANNGAVPEGAITAGLGMRGMRERISLIGGKLSWRADDGFSVTTELPLLGGASGADEKHGFVKR